MDICGEALAGDSGEITSTDGYVVSLNYPDDYSPDSSCQCLLSTTDPDSHLRLEVLDMHLSPGPNPTWARDWLEYVSELADWGEGTRLSGLQKGASGDVHSHQVYLNFKSDGEKEARGFWIRYQGEAPYILPPLKSLKLREIYTK